MDSNRTQLLNFRATKDEVTALLIMANMEGRNQSEMLRTILREAAANRGIKSIALVKATVPHADNR